MLFSEMKINEAYTIMTGVAALMYLIAFLMAASVTLFCAKFVVICCYSVFDECMYKGHYWFVLFILAGNYRYGTF